MSETSDDLARQARQHLASLKSAGVEWLPFAEVPEPAPADPVAPAAPLQVGLPMLEDGAALSVEQRRQELAQLAQKVAACRLCSHLASTRTQTVFGVGPIDPELCFIGEAPGADEDAQGEPFVGAAGQLLNRIIAACGMKREEVFICNILRCRPPGNRQPSADEAVNCRPFLDRTLELVKPKFICCLGATAAQKLLDTATPIGKLRGRLMRYGEIPVVCTYHPSYILRTPSADAQAKAKLAVWDDMKKLLTAMGKPIPQAKKGS